jgi:hypothetical protein
MPPRTQRAQKNGSFYDAPVRLLLGGKPVHLTVCGRCGAFCARRTRGGEGSEASSRVSRAGRAGVTAMTKDEKRLQLADDLRRVAGLLEACVEITQRLDLPIPSEADACVRLLRAWSRNVRYLADRRPWA